MSGHDATDVATMTEGQTSVWSVAGYAGPEGLALRDRPIPEPGPGEMVVEVEAVGLNPLDLKLLSGSLRQFMPVVFPFTPGSDICGRILSVGGEVTGYRPGDRVAGMTPAHGAMATHVLCMPGPALTRAPVELDAVQLAALPEAGMTALAILDAAQLSPGETVAIIGATGGIGLLLCQMASAAGAYVIATDAPGDEPLLRENGAREVIDYTAADAVETLRNRGEGRPEVLIDLIDQGEQVLGAARALPAGGRLVSTLMGPPPEAFVDVEVHYIRLSPRPGDMAQLVELLRTGAIRSNVSAVHPFAEAPAAYAQLRDMHVRGKIVVRVR